MEGWQRSALSDALALPVSPRMKSLSCDIRTSSTHSTGWKRFCLLFSLIVQSLHAAAFVKRESWTFKPLLQPGQSEACVTPDADVVTGVAWTFEDLSQDDTLGKTHVQKSGLHLLIQKSSPQKSKQAIIGSYNCRGRRSLGPKNLNNEKETILTENKSFPSSLFPSLSPQP